MNTPRAWVLVALLGAVWLPIAMPLQAGPKSPDPTWAGDVAPIFLENCTSCHRPGESGPFSFLTYQQVRRRGRQIVEVIRSGFMPPWLPEPGHGEFAGQRRLTSAQIELIERWVDSSMPLGDPDSIPEPPRWIDGWQLGEPDLVIEMDQPYILAAAGPEVFRNFVIPIPLSETRYVRAVELRPGNRRIVHHAVMRTDETRSSRLQATLDPEMGFGSMNMGDAKAPDGYLLSWTPGHQPDPGRAGFAWTLRPNTDFVLQLHLQPSGKPEPIQSRVGFYFSDGPPTKHVAEIMLWAREIDIPPGESAYTIKDSYRIPVDVDVISVYPHAHYLGKSFAVWADLPDGRREALIRIDDWDFNWQDEYRYAQPVRLPADSRVRLELVYDNSADNVRNPSSPPRRVRGGSRSVDEMGTLTLQVVPRTLAERETLREGLVRQDLEKDSDDWLAHYNLAAIAQKHGRDDEAIRHYRETLRLNPKRTKAMNNLARLLQSTGHSEEARELLIRAIEINPGYANAQLSLGLVLAERGQLEEARRHFSRAIELQPAYAPAHHNLGLLLQQLGLLDEAEGHLQQALRSAPDDASIQASLGNLRMAQGRAEQAVEHYRRALQEMPRLAEAHNNLANALFFLGDVEGSIEHYRTALEIDPGQPDTAYNLREALKLQAERDRAIAIAEAEVESTAGRDVNALMRLADTRASYGQVDEAVATATRALVLIEGQAGSEPLTQRIVQRIESYRTLRP